MVTVAGGNGLEAALGSITKKVQKASVNVGFLSGSTYPDGTSVPMVAAIQEFGAKGIPPRPFFRSMISKHASEWPDNVAVLLKSTGYDTKRTLETMGALIASQLRDSIIELVDPPLSPVTLMLRRMRADNPDLIVTGKIVGEAAQRVDDGKPYSGVSTKPLVYTGHLLNSVSYEVLTQG